MKNFFWKPFIIDPARPEHKEIIWAKVSQHEINKSFLEEVVDAFHDKRAEAAKTSGQGEKDQSAGVIKVTGPVKKQFFSGEESKKIQMNLPKLAKPDYIKRAVTTFADGIVTQD